MNIDDAVECGVDMSGAKETLIKVQKNNRKLFVRFETGMGKNIKNVLVIIHKSMTTERKELDKKKLRNYIFVCE